MININVDNNKYELQIEGNGLGAVMATRGNIFFLLCVCIYAYIITRLTPRSLHCISKENK